MPSVGGNITEENNYWHRTKSIDRDTNPDEAMTLSSDHVAYQSAVRHSMELM